MVKKIIGLLAFSAPWLLPAQITISVQLPPAGMIQKEQLWNLVLVNNGNAAIEATILLNLQDAVTGQPVLSAGSRTILLNKGVKMLTIADVQPVQYNYGGAIISGNYLPLGSYIACYTIASNTGAERPQTLADECVRVNINPLSPPLLITPADKSVSATPYPQFAWLPPAPIDMFSNLNYDLSVAEVLEGQSPAEAMLYNNPVYVNNNLKASFENYPSSYTRLDTGKLYVWQVTARNDMSYSATTQVWTFSIQPIENPQEKPVSIAYILVSRTKEAGGINYIEGNNLSIKYYSFDSEHQTTIKLLDTQGRLLQTIEQKIMYGDNFFNLTLNGSFQPGNQYLIEITDQKNMAHTGLFSIK